MDKQSLEYVLVSAYVCTPEPAGLIELRTGTLEQFPALAEVVATHMLGCRSRFRLPIAMGKVWYERSILSIR